MADEDENNGASIFFDTINLALDLQDVPIPKRVEVATSILAIAAGNYTDGEIDNRDVWQSVGTFVGLVAGTAIGGLVGTVSSNPLVVGLGAYTGGEVGATLGEDAANALYDHFNNSDNPNAPLEVIKVNEDGSFTHYKHAATGQFLVAGELVTRVNTVIVEYDGQGVMTARDFGRTEIKGTLQNAFQIESFQVQECFPGDTEIQLWNGSTKPIREITTSDTVLTFNAAGVPQPGRVNRLFQSTTDEWLRLSFEDGREPIFVTPGHRFLTETGDYLEIGHLVRLGGGRATVVMQDGATKTVQAERIAHSNRNNRLFEEVGITIAAGDVRAAREKGWRTYNFEVAEHHNYVAAGVRVHNDSALSFLEENEIPIAFSDENNDGDVDRYVAELRAEDGSFIGTVTVVADPNQSTNNTTKVERKYEIDRDGVGPVEITVVNQERKGANDENIVESSVITELNINGSQIGSDTLKSLTPFLSNAIIGDDASILARVATDTVLSTLLGNIGEYIGGVWDVKLSGLGKQFEDAVNGDLASEDIIDKLGKDLFEDLGTDLAINGISSTVSIVNQLIMTEIFGEIEFDGVGGAVAEQFINYGSNYFLNQGVTKILNSEFGKDVFELFNASDEQITKIKDAFGGGDGFGASFKVALPGLITNALIKELLPPIETLEGMTASAITSTLVSSFVLKTGAGAVSASALGYWAGPVGAVVGFAIGQIFDELFSVDPQAWSNVGFNPITGQFEITGTWSQGGGDPELSQALAQTYIDAMNGFVAEVKSQSHNFEDLAKWSFGHYESFVSNLGQQGHHFEDFQENYLNAYITDLTNVQLNDGQMTAVRGLESIDVAKLREEHRLKLFLEALNDHDIVTDAQYEFRLLQGGHDPSPEQVYVEYEATTFRQKLAYFANDGGHYTGPTTGDFGHDGDGTSSRSPFRFADGVHELVMPDLPGTAQQDAGLRLDVHTKLAIDQFTQSQVLLDFLSGSTFQTYEEFLAEFDLPETTYDDTEIFGLIASTLQIAHDYNTYLENTETINSLIAAAPESNLAAGWVQTLISAKDLGLAEAFDLTGDGIGNLFLTADGNDSVTGNNGDDLVKTYGGEDEITGGNGNDNLNAGNDNDTLDGGYGNDTLDGGAGSDVLTGGRGSDIYVFKSGDGEDTVEDFNGADDLIRFMDLEFEDLTITQVGADVEISYGTAGKVALKNTSVSDVSEAKFVFGAEEEVPASNDNNQMLRLFFDVLNDYDVVTSTQYETRKQGTGPHAPDVPVFVEYEATSFREKVEYFATDGSDHVVPSTGDFGHDGDGSGPRSPFRHSDGSHVTVMADEVGTAQQDAKAGFDAQTRLAITQLTQSQILLDFLSSSSFQTYEQFSAEFNFASEGDDEFRGTHDADHISTFGGHDLLVGYNGNDQLYGGSGSDTLVGGQGHDDLVGGSGSDVFLFGDGDGTDAINDFNASVDTIRFTDLQFTDLTITQIGQDVDISYGTDNNVRVLNSSVSNVTQNGLAFGSFDIGDQVLVGGAGNNNLVGGSGYDFITGGLGEDTLRGGSGNDTYYWSHGDGDDTLYDTGGSLTQVDTLILTDVASTEVNLGVKNGHHLMVAISGSGNDETIQVSSQYLSTNDGKGIERIEFSDGVVWQLDDILAQARYDGNANNNTLAGSGYRDNIFGLGGHDTLKGNNGADWLDGGKGNDKLTGGWGLDTFVFRSGDGTDRITDFNEAKDTILFEGLTFDDLSITQNGSEVRIAYSGGLLKVWSSDASDFTEAVFEFV